MCIQLIAVIFAIFLIIFLNMRMRKVNFSQSFLFLGFGTPNFRQLLVGSLSGLFYLLISVFIPYGFNFKFVLCPYWFLMLLFMLLGPGIYEQILIQGFVFRNLREEMPFIRAAIISGIVFALVHSYYLFDGLTRQNLVAVLHFSIDSLLIACPFALLFERGNWVLWGVAVAHFGIDVNGYVFNLVPISRTLILPVYWTWGFGILVPWQVGGIISVTCTAMFIFLLTKWLLPSKTVGLATTEK